MCISGRNKWGFVVLLSLPKSTALLKLPNRSKYLNTKSVRCINDEKINSESKTTML